MCVEKMSTSVSLLLLFLYLLCLVTPLSSYAKDNTYRSQFCKHLPVGERCVPDDPNLFGPPPADAVIDKSVISLCKGESCTEIPQIQLPPTEDIMPKGSTISVHQKLSVIAKNGERVDWDGGWNSYAWGDGQIWGDEKSSSYDLTYFQAFGYFLVFGHFYENATYDWVSYENGRRYSFMAEPQLSPDGNNMIMQESESFEAAYDDGRSQKWMNRLYRISREDIVETATFDVKGSYVWITPDDIGVFKVIWRTTPEEWSLVARIRRDKGHWMVVPDCHGRGRKGVTSTADVIVRDRPSREGKILRKIGSGINIEVLERDGECRVINGDVGQWVKLRVGDLQEPQEAWMFDAYISYDQ
jgi:hypothetical protein